MTICNNDQCAKKKKKKKINSFNYDGHVHTL